MGAYPLASVTEFVLGAGLDGVNMGLSGARKQSGLEEGLSLWGSGLIAQADYCDLVRIYLGNATRTNANTLASRARARSGRSGSLRRISLR